jgi:hypothetical protein
MIKFSNGIHFFYRKKFISLMETDDLVRKLFDCVAECNRCMAECLNEADVSMMARCIELDTDCAEICALTAGFLSRNSESGDTLLALCGEICQACGDECAKHDAEHCIRCAAVCHDCAEACRNS